MQFFPVSQNSHLAPHITLKTILKHPQPTFFPKYDQPCFPPIYNRHSIFRNDIPLWYMIINCKNTYITFLLVACFGCCEKQIIILQPLIGNIITYFSIPIRWFSSQLHVSGIWRITTMNVLTFYQNTLFIDGLTTPISYMHTEQYT